MLRSLISIAKIIFFFIMVVLYFSMTVPLYPLLYLRPYQTRKILNHLVSLYSIVVLWVLGFRPKLHSMATNDHQKNYFFVSNHQTYMDVLLLSKFFRSAYVTSVEMKETLLLGQITQLAGCVFVERRNKRNLHKEIQEITQALENGITVTVFPEATSTNGSEVIRFRRPLYQAAIDSETSIIPIAINYESIDGQKVTTKNRDKVCWYGEMSFIPHLYSLGKCKKIVCSVIECAAIDVQKTADLEALVAQTHQVISSHFKPIET